MLREFLAATRPLPIHRPSVLRRASAIRLRLQLREDAGASQTTTSSFSLGPFSHFSFVVRLLFLNLPRGLAGSRSIKVAFYRRLRHRPKENEIFFPRFLVQSVLILVLEGSLANGGQILTAHDLTSLFFLFFSFF